jgi:hypothetical protein
LPAHLGHGGDTALRGLLVLALIGGGFWLKLRHEEVWMRECFGAPMWPTCSAPEP